MAPLAATEADRPSSTRRVTPTRSISLRLIVTSSFAIVPASARQRVTESGHFYLGRRGHSYLGATDECPITDIMSTTWPISRRYVDASDETVENVGLNPTRTRVRDAPLAMGTDLQAKVTGQVMGEPVGSARAAAEDGCAASGLRLALRSIDEMESDRIAYAPRPPKIWWEPARIPLRLLRARPCLSIGCRNGSTAQSGEEHCSLALVHTLNQRV